MPEAWQDPYATRRVPDGRPPHPRPHLLPKLKLGDGQPTPADIFVGQVLFAVLCAACINAMAWATWLCVLEPLVGR